ncbi:hypothetical protein [Robertkochia aurantiaca]|uniref:hypothetical protein n=1 Tax=Robertkochia aurantiaca TaxID=2873700 RepID=UPI001CCB7E7C|nr:hypothetical protein [Robertkochia sp. 3YJGBD-33]
MIKNLFALLLAALVMTACGKDDEPSTGDLTLMVTLNNMEPAINAKVYTSPATSEIFTDDFGMAIFKGLPSGSITLFAELEGVGSAQTSHLVETGKMGVATINITSGIAEGTAPVIQPLTPEGEALFSDADLISFSAQITDDFSSSGDISVSWESDLDGTLFSGNPNSENVSLFEAELSRGIHTITITATDGDGYETTASMTVNTKAPRLVNLISADKATPSVNLNWEAYTGIDFAKYEILRSSGDCETTTSYEVIAVIDAQSTTTYTDTETPFEEAVCYKVRVTNIDAYTRDSNGEGVLLPAGDLFSFKPFDVVKHPSQPYLYVLDRTNLKLYKYNYSTYTIEGETDTPGTIGYMDIGENGSGVELYLPSHDGWIYIYNPETLTEITAISTGLPNASVVIDGNGLVIAGLEPDPWWEQPIRSYSRADGTYLGGNGDNERDRLRMIPGKQEIMSISTSVSPIDMEYLKLAADGSFELHQDDAYHGDYPLNAGIFRIDPSGTYAITDNEGAVYHADGTMTFIGLLQRGSLDYSDYAFNADGSVIYAASSNHNSIQIGSYPALTKNSEILIKGYPNFIYRAGNELITISQKPYSNNLFGVEVTPIP